MAKKYVDADKLLQELEDRCEDCLVDNAEPWCKHNCEYADLLLRLDHMPGADVVEINCAYNEKEDTPSLFRCSNCNWYCNDTTPGDKTDGDDPYSYNYCPNCGRRIRRKKDAKTN